MKYYVKYAGIRAIAGPMSKDEAIEKSGQTKGLLFRGDIYVFFAEFKPSTDVPELINELNGLRDAQEIIRTGEDDSIGQVLQRVIALLGENSSVEANDVVVSLGVLKVWTEEDRNLNDVRVEIRQIVERSIDVIHSLSREKVAFKKGI